MTSPRDLQELSRAAKDSRRSIVTSQAYCQDTVCKGRSVWWFGFKFAFGFFSFVAILMLVGVVLMMSCSITFDSMMRAKQQQQQKTSMVQPGISQH